MKYCPKCGTHNDDYAMHCSNCGTPFREEPQHSQYQQPQYQEPQNYYQQPQYQQPVNVYNVQSSQPQIPPEYRPLSPWGYFGYMLLFSIPIVGFIMLIVFSFNNDNINRRNFARSYFCYLLIALIVAGIVVGILAAAGVFSYTTHSSYRYYW